MRYPVGMIVKEQGLFSLSKNFKDFLWIHRVIKNMEEEAFQPNQMSIKSI